MTTFLLVNCSKDKPLQNEVAWKKVCTDWGTDMNNIKIMMNKYKVKASSASSLMYTGSGRYTSVSYRFDNDSLYATVVVVPAEKYSITEIRSSFSGFTSLGERSGSSLYLDRENNTIVTISEQSKSEVNYYVIGYSAYMSEK